ncbi:hypothetical protein Q6293_27930, partial [Klebsiella pneumoniae]|uniref:hypothetical protein n=1 Tax=Klebsiella pneumoniae TaxID=573 RepID=UPI0027312A00
RLRREAERRANTQYLLERDAILAAKPGIESPGLQAHSSASRRPFTLPQMLYNLVKKINPAIHRVVRKATLQRHQAVNERRPLALGPAADHPVNRFL